MGDDLREAVQRAFEQVTGSGALVLAALGLAALGGAGYVVYRSRRRRWAAGHPYTLLAAGERRGVVRAYERLMRDLRRHVAPREAGETAGGYFARLAERFPHLRDELAKVHALVDEAAYRPVPLDASRAEAIQERLRSAARRIEGSDGAEGGSRTHTPLAGQRILSPPRLPFRHLGPLRTPQL